MTVEWLLRATRHGVRLFVRQPMTSITSALCLGVGIAACAISWTLLDTAILRPFGLANVNRLVVIWEADLSRGQQHIEVSHLDFLDWQRQARTFESAAAFASSHWPALARIGSETVPVAARAVSQTFFATVGIRPVLGRDFTATDLDQTVSPPIVLSYRMWQSQFAGNDAVVGQSIFVDGTDHRVIAVMPRGFGYPDDPDAWISVERALAEAFADVPLDQQRKVGVLEVLGRKRSGVSNEAVDSELNAIIASLQRRYEGVAGRRTAVVNDYSEVLLGRLGPRLWITLGMAAIVLLFACGNVAAVRMAQHRERATELAARVFLGSSRSRLTAELSIETVPLLICAVGAAMLMWASLVTLLATASVVAESGLLLVGPRSVTSVIVWLGVFSWILVGVVPSCVAASLRISQLQMSSRRETQRTSVIGMPLLFGQAAAAIVVIAVAGAAVQAFDRLSRIDLGFALTDVMLVDVALPHWQFPSIAERRRLTDDLRQALQGTSGVANVAAVSIRPFRFGDIVDGIRLRRQGDSTLEPSDAVAASRVVITPEYFAALRQPIVAGRGFTEFDRGDTERVAVVSRSLARVLWGDDTAVGKRLETFTLDDGWQSKLVVGIAGDARYRGLELPSIEIYFPHTQSASDLGTYVIATQPGGNVTEHVVRNTMRRVEANIALERVQSTSDLVRTVLSPSRLLATVMSLLAGSGLFLLTVGVFGAAAAALRVAWAEIAVRQAIGATPLQAARAPLGVLSRALTIGVVVGLLAAPLALSAVEVLGVKATRIALPLLAGAVGVVVAAAIATGPALWRAVRSSPADLLRNA